MRCTRRQAHTAQACSVMRCGTNGIVDDIWDVDERGALCSSAPCSLLLVTYERVFR
jgi:hypothetical protein